MITKITPTHPACYGVCCQLHARCARYAAVEGSVATTVLDTCDPGDGSRPQFVEVNGSEVAA
jgi:hypothetical protein